MIILKYSDKLRERADLKEYSWANYLVLPSSSEDEAILNDTEWVGKFAAIENLLLLESDLDYVMLVMKTP